MPKPPTSLDVEAAFLSTTVEKFLSPIPPDSMPVVFQAVDQLGLSDPELGRSIGLMDGPPGTAVSRQRINDWRMGRRALPLRRRAQIVASLEHSVKCLRDLYARAGNPYDYYFGPRFAKAEEILREVLTDPAVLTLVQGYREKFKKLEQTPGWRKFYEEQEKKVLSMAGRSQ